MASSTKQKSRILLYYSSKCRFSKEFLSMVIPIPSLAEQIVCVDVDHYKVPHLEIVPAINDGTSPRLFEGKYAFEWLMKKMESMVETKEVAHSHLKNCEFRLSELMEPPKEITTNKKTVQSTKKVAIRSPEKEMVRMLAFQEQGAFAGLDFSTPKSGNIKDRFEKLHKVRKSSKNDLNYENSEKRREEILEEAKKLWIRKKLVDPALLEQTT